MDKHVPATLRFFTPYTLKDESTTPPCARGFMGLVPSYGTVSKPNKPNNERDVPNAKSSQLTEEAQFAHVDD